MKKIMVLFSLLFSSYSFGKYDYAGFTTTGMMSCLPKNIHAELGKLQNAIISFDTNIQKILKSHPIPYASKIQKILITQGEIFTELTKLTCKKDATKKSLEECAKSRGSWIANACYFPQNTTTK